MMDSQNAAMVEQSVEQMRAAGFPVVEPSDPAEIEQAMGEWRAASEPRRRAERLACGVVDAEAVEMGAEPVTATSALLHRTLAAADVEGLPVPISTQVNGRLSEPELHVHVVDAEHRDRWQEWLTRRDAGEWVTNHHDTYESRYNHARGVWRGWRVELVYLTPLESAADIDGSPGDIYDPQEVSR